VIFESPSPSPSPSSTDGDVVGELLVVAAPLHPLNHDDLSSDSILSRREYIIIVPGWAAIFWFVLGEERALRFTVKHSGDYLSLALC